ncbi:MAG: zinc-binding dehydrogenase [Vulcanimicrobiaceae bacterium]
MKAAIFYGPNRPLELEERPMPIPGPGEVVVKVAACGLCHTDLHYIDHGVATFCPPPLILGHEASGIVAAVGSGIEGRYEGDRVLIPALLTCGTCDACRRGRENICEHGIMPGNHIDGAYAEYIRVPAKDLLALPEDLPLEDACLIADAVSTPYHAVVNRGEVRAGQRVVVFGCGGVGINVIQIAVASGAEVWAVDLQMERLEQALRFGAGHIVHSADNTTVAREVRSQTHGGADVAFEVIGNPLTMRQAFDSLHRGGRLVVVGYSDRDFPLSAAKLMFNEMDVRGSLGCRPIDYPRIIEMARQGRIAIKPLVTGRFSLDDINSGLDALRAGSGLRNIVVPGI